MAKHTFAVFTPSLARTLQQKKDTYYSIDKELLHRITRVLRLHVGDLVVVFDSHESVTLRLLQSNQKEMLFFGETAVRAIVPLLPRITWLLPLLEKQAFEDALYACAAMGVTSIYPVVTEKTHNKTIAPRELERYQRIMIAACEQAKQFTIPLLHPVLSLEDALTRADKNLLFFCVEGQSAFECLRHLREQKLKEITLLVGPEGDLTEREKALVDTVVTYSCLLTPTILRAVDAVALGTGLLRSCL